MFGLDSLLSSASAAAVPRRLASGSRWWAGLVWKTGRVGALQFGAYGGPEVLVWAEAADPHAGAGPIRIVVRAASVNPIEWTMLVGAISGGQPLVGTG